MMLRAWLAVLLLLVTACAAMAAEAPALQLETKIPIGDVSVRIDHLAIDPARLRLFVAERGNNSLAIVDLDRGKLARRITGLRAPQGVAYDRGSDTIVVANGGNGSVRLFAGATLAGIATIALDFNADNLRADGRGLVYVGHGRGLAIIDAAKHQRVGDIPLPGHPEGFEIAQGRVFVNLPETRSVDVFDAASREHIATWPVPELRGNFPMAAMEDGRQLAVMFRSPPALVVLDGKDGHVAARVPSCADADDVFWDAKRNRLYVSCGAGFVDIIATAPNVVSLSRIATAPGARTALFVPERDRLYVAVRAQGNEREAIWVYRPQP